MATAIFFITAVVTARVLHGDLPAINTMDWTLGPNGNNLLLLQAVPLALSTFLYLSVR